MTPPFFENHFYKRSKLSRSISSHSEISSVSISDVSEFPNVSLLSSSSFQCHKAFRNYTPRPQHIPNAPRPFKKPFPSQGKFFKPHHSHPGPGHNRPEPHPLPYFGEWRDGHGIVNAERKMKLSDLPPLEKVSRSSTPMPPLITSYITPPDDTPGPSWMNSEDFEPFPEKKPKFSARGREKSSISTAVCHASPDCKLTEEQGKFIQSELVKALDNTPKERSPPRFLRSFYDQGVFWMVCADEKTRQWLIENVALLNDLWEDLNLKVETVKMPKRPIIYVDLPELDKTVEVLDRLAAQNEDLHTDSWTILNRHVYRSRQRVTFSIDMDSFEVLKSKNFTVAWKLQTVTFKVPSKGVKSRVGKWVKETEDPTPAFKD